VVPISQKLADRFEGQPLDPSIGFAFGLYNANIGLGDPQQINEQGAPDFGGASGTRIDIGDTWTTPFWTTAGTFYIACAVHSAMNLTVTVTD